MKSRASSGVTPATSSQWSRQRLAAGAAAQVVLVHDRGGMPVGETVLVAQPVDPLVEAQEPGPVLEGSRTNAADPGR